MAIDSCLTGQGSSLTTANATLKFGNVAATTYGIRRIGGFGRSVVVIDDSDLSIAAGDAMQYCPGDLVALRPGTIEVKQDTDNTTRFNTGTGPVDMNQPLPLGEASGTTDEFVLTFASTHVTNAPKLEFSGFFIDDSGIDLIHTDRQRSTFQLQPDGQRWLVTVGS